MEDNNNTGCVILFVLGVIGAIIYYVCTMSSEDFALIGSIGILGVVIAIGYFIFKCIGNSSSSDDNSGCLKVGLTVGGIIVFLLILFNTLTADSDINTGLGIFVFIIVVIGGAIYGWKSLNE